MAVEVEQLAPYLTALLEQNRTINLTAIRDPDAARVLHGVDSLAVQDLTLDLGPPPHRCLDLGTGNGFPGVVLSLVFPGAEVTLLDRTRKKLAAIERALAAAGMTEGFTTVHADAAQAPRTHEELVAAFALVTSRAVADPVTIAKLAFPFLRAGGHLVLWLDESTAAPRRLEGFADRRILEYDLPAPARRRRRLASYRQRRRA